MSEGGGAGGDRGKVNICRQMSLCISYIIILSFRPLLSGSVHACVELFCSSAHREDEMRVDSRDLYAGTHERIFAWCEIRI